jgi:hypothetical protein
MPGLMDGYQGSLHMAADNFMAGKRMNYNYDFAAIFQYARDHSDLVRTRKNIMRNNMHKHDRIY